MLAFSLACSVKKMLCQMLRPQSVNHNRIFLDLDVLWLGFSRFGFLVFGVLEFRVVRVFRFIFRGCIFEG